MSLEKKYKRNYLPSLRRLTKEIEDAIVEKDLKEEKELREKLISILKEIEEADYSDK